MARKTNKLLQADERLEDDEIFAERQARVEAAAEEAHDDNDEEVEQDLVLDDDDMYEAEREYRATQEAAGNARTANGEKSNKGKGVKGASKAHDKDDDWAPAHTLAAPAPRPGMVQRWIRHALGNDNDPRNWTRAMREGWKPRTLDTVPDDYEAPTITHSVAGTVICIGDLILCEMRVERFKSRRKYFRERLARQLQAIERKPLDVAERLGGPGIKVNKKKDVSFGRGRKARATDDE